MAHIISLKFQDNLYNQVKAKLKNEHIYKSHMEQIIKKIIVVNLQAFISIVIYIIFYKYYNNCYLHPYHYNLNFKYIY